MGSGPGFGRSLAGLVLCVAALSSCARPGATALIADPSHPEAAPRGYIAFCTKDPSFCDGTGPLQVALNAERWHMLLRTNDKINNRLKPTLDKPPIGEADDWEIPTGAAGDKVTADCEDYVLAKKAELVKKGWPKTALRIAIAEQGPRDKHAVLIADTDEGVFVLDNLERRILRAEEAGYRWVAVQASTDPDRWDGIAGDRPLSP